MRMEGHSDQHIDARMEKLIDLYLEGLREGARAGKFNVRPLEGVIPLLDALEPRKDVILGLLTGNVEPGARIKLTAAGIDPDRFRVNAFGSDHEHRPAARTPVRMLSAPLRTMTDSTGRIAPALSLGHPVTPDSRPPAADGT